MVRSWDGPRFARTLRHLPGSPEYNPHFRQLLHVSFKLAAKAGTRYTGLLKAHEAIIAKNVTENTLARHLLPIFVG